MALANFLGCLPLPFAVLFAFIQCLARAFVFLCLLSSSEEFMVAGVSVSGIVQVLMGTFSLAGPPLAILAGCGALFRMERYVTSLSHYLVANTLIDGLFALVVLGNGGVCAAIAHEVLLRRGPMFVCAFVNIGVTFWVSVYLAFEAYLAFAVRSQAGLLHKGEFAELIPYAAGPRL